MKLKLKLITALILISIVKSSAQQADFSGKWKVDTLKSDFGKVPHFVIFDQATIRQTKDSINLITVTVNQNGQANPAITLTYALNGSPRQRISQDTVKMVSSYTYSGDKKILIKKQVKSSTLGSQNISTTTQESWTLSSDGKELTVKRDFKSFNKKELSYTITAVYDKQ